MNQSTLLDGDAVAIVDDDDSSREALQFLMMILGRRPRAFHSAVAFLAASSEIFACLLFDQHMPTMTGLELASQLRSANNTIPILLLSGDLTPAIRARAGQIGIDRVCEKPALPGMIFEFVDRVFGPRTV